MIQTKPSFPTRLVSTAMLASWHRGAMTLELLEIVGPSTGACSYAAVAIEDAAGIFGEVALLDGTEWCAFEATIRDTNVMSGGFPDPVYSSDSLSFDFVFSADDAGALTAFYPDSDNDGYGNSSATASMLFDPPPSYVADNTDCDDGNPGVNPGAVETLDDGIDSNCDGFDNT